MHPQANMFNASFLSLSGRLTMFLLVILFAMVPLIASAAGFFGPLAPDCGTVNGADNLCGFCDFATLAQNIIDFIIAFSIIVATFMIVYAGFLYISASSNPGQVGKAHRVFYITIIGLVIVLASWLIVNIVMITFLNGSIIQDLGGSWGSLPGCGGVGSGAGSALGSGGPSTGGPSTGGSSSGGSISIGGSSGSGSGGAGGSGSGGAGGAGSGGGPPPVPTLSFSVSRANITEGESTMLLWTSTDADSCTASGGWSGNKSTLNSESVSPNVDTTYTLACTGAGGSVNKSVSVTVEASLPTGSYVLEVKRVVDGQMYQNSFNTSAECMNTWNSFKNISYYTGGTCTAYGASQYFTDLRTYVTGTPYTPNIFNTIDECINEVNTAKLKRAYEATTLCTPS